MSIRPIPSHPVKFISYEELDVWLLEARNREGVRWYTHPGYFISTHKVEPKEEFEQTGFHPEYTIKFDTLTAMLNYVCAKGGLEPGYYIIQDQKETPMEDEDEED